MTSPELTARGVGKRFGRGPWILTGVDLELLPGGVTAVLGGNGSGKSTLLRMLAGLSRPTTGSVHRVCRSVGYLPERFAVADRMTAGSYLRHMARIAGLTAADATARGADLLERLALRPGPDTAMRALSKGNAQKVAIAVAVIARPRLLVLDEPWSGLDTAAHPVLAELITGTAARGGHVVFTDHGEAAAATLATTVHHIAGGRLHAEPPPAKPKRLTVRPGAPVDWRAVPGVLEVDAADRPVLVAAEHCDAVLRLALRHGWSVDEVSR